MPLTAQALLDNLEDAGCNSQFMERFLALEQFPLTKNGKIDRNALKQQLEVEAC